MRRRWAWGALAHDIARAMKGEQLLQKAPEFGISVHPVEAQVPLLLHGPVAAELLRRVDGLEDRDIYEAVYWHSTAHKDLGAVAKLVFLADKLDPQKLSRYPFQPELNKLALTSLDRAIFDFLSRELISLLQQGSLVHPVGGRSTERAGAKDAVTIFSPPSQQSPVEGTGISLSLSPPLMGESESG